MNPLGPITLIVLKLVAVLALVMGVYAWGHSRGDDAGYARGHAETMKVQHDWDADRARMAQAALAETEHHAQNEAAIAAEKEKADHVAQAAQVERDRARADASAAHRSLLDAARAAAADPGRGQADDHSALVPVGGLSGLCAGGVRVGLGCQRPADALVGVLEGVDQTAGDLADYADDLVVRLGSCRSQYESVRSHSQ